MDFLPIQWTTSNEDNSRGKLGATFKFNYITVSPEESSFMANPRLPRNNRIAFQHNDKDILPFDIG